jgi:cytochrome P450
MHMHSTSTHPATAPSRRSFLTGLGTVIAASSLPAWTAVAHTGASERVTIPAGVDPAYLRGAVEPFVRTSIYVGQRLSLPMIDLAFSKEAAIPPHIWGMLYDDWQPAMEEEGLSVFLQGLENRGPNNARKRIYTSALTPDLYREMYAPKVRVFLDELFREDHAGEPLMQHYYDGYFDMYWDLHLGVRGDDIPDEVRAIGEAFNTVLGFWDPRTEIVYENYMRVRELRPGLRDWIDDRVQDIIDGNIEHPERTFVHYWIENGNLEDNFRRKDIVFECFHNFLAFSQWGNTLYNVMARLGRREGDPVVQEWFQRTMQNNPDERDDGPFTPLDRFVMELFRTISPNEGSLSTVEHTQEGVTGTSFVLHPHPETSEDERHWQNPQAFDPDRYRTTPTAADIGEERCAAIGFARCPFEAASFSVEDGREAELPNNGFGTVFATVDGEEQPLVDHAGYAPFGFGYRRCAGEWLTVDVIKDVLRKVWDDGIVFERLDLDEPQPLPVGPVVVIEDDIAFRRA